MTRKQIVMYLINSGLTLAMWMGVLWINDPAVRVVLTTIIGAVTVGGLITFWQSVPTSASSRALVERGAES